MTDDEQVRCPVPRARPDVDRSVLVLVRGYRFLPKLRARFHADAVETRLLGQRVLCVGGADGARLFYDEARMQRDGAVPAPLANLLFGRGAVHGLDGAAHEHRKAMFLSLLDDEASRDLSDRTVLRWQQVLTERSGETVSVFDLGVEILGAAACDWAGVPSGRIPAGMFRRLATIVDGFGSVGPRHLRGRWARARCDRWAATLIRDVRDGRPHVPPMSPLAVIAAHTNPDGTLLSERTAAVELLNLLRPTVAVAWLLDYAALALHGNPHWLQRLHNGNDQDAEAFALEVRRRCPFVPALAARTRHDLKWHGIAVPAGRLVILDVYGTDHDPGRYPEPEHFDPDRFAAAPDPFGYLPQGGGLPTGHRCPGERVSIESIKAFMRVLSEIEYEVPAQDLRIRLSRMPARIDGGFQIRPRAATARRLLER
jgi:fatty-acid peroxygenase